MKPNLLYAALLLGAALSQNAAQAAEYDTVLADQSTLAFTVRQMSVPVEGRFKTFTAQLRFDPAKPELAAASLDIDLANIDAGSDEANDEVAGPHWFDTQHHPVARFVAVSVRPLADNRFEIAGELTIKGSTQAVTASANFHARDNLGVLDGSLIIKRADFSIGEGPWADFSTVANEIPVRFRFVLSATPRT
jgi:polyisoprenoid-binding protein YceI